MLGTTRDEVLNMSLDDVIAQSEKGSLRELWRQMAKSNTVSGEITFRSLGGETVITTCVMRANVLPGLHLGMCREVRRTPQKIPSVA